MRENRINQIIRPDLVTQVLPEHFATSYPKLITFIDEYYSYMDSDGQVGSLIKDLIDIRDIESTKLEYLDNMFGEMALGVGQQFFTEPREVLRNFAKFFRVKGSLYSAEGFFRAFYNNNDAEILYPKNDIFTIGDSASFIGHESQKILQDGEVYQVLSIFIKSDISLGAYQDFYKRFVHPAGFFLSAEMRIENEDRSTKVNAFEPKPYIDPDLNIDSGFDIARIGGEIIPCISVAEYRGITPIYMEDNVYTSPWSFSDYDSSKWLTLDSGIGSIIDFGSEHTLKNVDTSTPLTEMFSSQDSWGYNGTWTASDSIGNVLIQDWVMEDSSTLIGGNYVGAPRFRSILEYVACGGINSNEPVHHIKSSLISDIDHKTINKLKDTLI